MEDRGHRPRRADMPDRHRSHSHQRVQADALPVEEAHRGRNARHARELLQRRQRRRRRPPERQYPNCPRRTRDGLVTDPYSSLPTRSLVLSKCPSPSKPESTPCPTNQPVDRSTANSTLSSRTPRRTASCTGACRFHGESDRAAPQHRWNALVRRFVGAGHDVAVLAPSPHYPSGRAHPGDASLRPGAVTRGPPWRTDPPPPVPRARRNGGFPRPGPVGLLPRMPLAWAWHASRVSGVRTSSSRRRPDSQPAAGRVLSTVLRVPLVMWRCATPGRTCSTFATSGSRAHRDAHRPHGTVQPPWRPCSAFPITVMQRGADAVVTTTDLFADVLHGCACTRCA